MSVDWALENGHEDAAALLRADPRVAAALAAKAGGAGGLLARLGSPAPTPTTAPPAASGGGPAEGLPPHVHSPACNHAPAPEGAVMAAAKAGNVRALRIALDAGGSTEEADKVRGSMVGGTTLTCPPTPHAPSSHCLYSAAGRLDCPLLGRMQRPP